MKPARPQYDWGHSPRLLVVNADDLGRTAGINEGIFDAHERGVVSSAP